MIRRFILLQAGLLLLVASAATASEYVSDISKHYASGEYDKAAQSAREAKDVNDARSQIALGAMYGNGQGVPQDYVASAKWYQKAAEQGDAHAQNMLASYYSLGYGVENNYKIAAQWYRKSAEQGDMLSQYMLGDMYLRGLGVPQDYVLAHMWLNLSAAQGWPDASTRRDVCLKVMTPAQIAEAQKMAREWKSK